MSNTFTHDTYLSPFTWRYGSDAMRQIWSDSHKRRLWRRIWVALAQAQQSIGLVSDAQVADLKQHQDDIDIGRALELEAELRHDLMAEVHTFAEQCPIGGGIIHLGATSMDIEDNADALRLREACELVLDKLVELLHTLAETIDTHADITCMAFTHLQPAEPTTLGYRLAVYGQDLLADYQSLQQIYQNIKGKGFKGAVGTSASYHQLLKGTNVSPRELETHVMSILGLTAFDVTHQTYPRRQDWQIVNTLAGIAMTVYKFAFDLRLLQSPPYGEWAEPFGKHQVGSSAMPFKRNPVNAENINSLARYLAALPRVMWDNAAHSLLERTLDDSGNRRAVLPDAFLAAEEIVLRMTRLLSGLQIDMHAIQHNLDTYGIFAATERLLMEAVRSGGNRQELHEAIRQHSLSAWDALQQGRPNPLAELLASDPQITQLIDADQVRELLHADDYVGDAPPRARAMAQQIHAAISDTL